MSYQFVWDQKREEENLKRHGTGFKEAMEVFADPRVIHLEDKKHSSIESRFYAVGRTLDGKVLTVRYTWRGKTIRIFGAARWCKWRKFYEKNSGSK